MSKFLLKTMAASLLMLIAISPQMRADDYTPLNYIECNGSISRANAFTTKYVGKANTEIDIKFYSYSTGWWTCIFSGRGTETSDGRTGYSLYQNGGNNSYFGYFAGGNSKDEFMTGNTLNVEHTVVATLGGISLDGADQVASGWTNFSASTNGISLFANPNNDNPYNGRIYYMTIKEDGETVRDYQPVMRHDGVFGYYDSYTKEFVQPAQGSYAGYTAGYADGNFYFTGLNYTSLDLSLGKTATITPNYVGTAPTFSYSSSAPDVAEVSSYGTVTPLSEGTTTITVTALDATYGEWTRTCTVNVVDESKTSYTEVECITANGIERANCMTSDYNPVTSTKISIGFTASASGGWYGIFCARNTFSGTGISLYKNGNTNANFGYFTGSTGSSADAFAPFTANARYDVVADVTNLRLTVNGTTTDYPTGNTVTYPTTNNLSIFANPDWDNSMIGSIYYLTITDDNNTYEYKPVMRHDGILGFYDSNSGKFFTAAQNSMTGYSATYKSSSFYLTGLSSASVTLNVGISTTIIPTYQGTTPTFTYTSADETIATVDANGKITGVTEGTTTVTVTADAGDGTGMWSQTCTVEVVDVTKTTYTELDYIAANGITRENAMTSDYIPVTATTIKIGFVAQATGGWTGIFCARNKNAGTGISLYKNGNDKNFGYFTGSTTGSGDTFASFTSGQRYDMIADVTQLQISTDEGSTYTTYSTGNSTTNATSRCLSIFANPEWDYPMVGRIYYLTIEEGTTTYEYKPVMRHDGILGFYDSNSGKFFTAAAGDLTGYSAGYKSGVYYLEATSIKVAIGGTKNLVEKEDGITYTFVSADDAIASVNDDGVVSGVAEGTTTVLITATVEATGEMWKCTSTVIVASGLDSYIASFPLKTWKQGGVYQCEYLEVARANTGVRRPDADNTDWGEVDYVPTSSMNWTSGYGPFVNTSNSSSNFNGEGTVISDYGTTASTRKCLFARRMFNIADATELTKITNGTVIISVNYNQFTDVILNGNTIISAAGDGNPWYTVSGTYVYFKLSDTQKSYLKVGNNVLAAMICEGPDPQYLDFGISLADDYSIDEDGVITSSDAVVTNDGLSSYVSTNLSNCTAIDLSGALELATTAYTSSQNVTADGIATMLSGTNVLTTVPTNSGITGTNIVNGGTISDLVLTDKVNFEPGQNFDATAQTATYTRHMNTGTNWGTIILPFNVSVTDDADVAFYQVESKTEDGALNVVKTNTLLIGTPALFKTNSESFTLTATDATVMSDIDQSTKGGLTLIGTYKRDTVDVDNTYYIKDNKFYSKGNYSFIVSPFRAYLQDPSGKSNGFSIVVDDDPTGINGAATGEAGNEIEGVYSVSGVKQSTLQKGINIVRYRNGKTQKVILK